MLQDKNGLTEGKVWGNAEEEGVLKGDVYYMEGENLKAWNAPQKIQ